MTLTVDGQKIAECRIQTIDLRQVIGAYELFFSLQLDVYAGKANSPKATILGANVAVVSNEGSPRKLGFAQPEQSFSVVCADHIYENGGLTSLVSASNSNFQIGGTSRR